MKGIKEVLVGDAAGLEFTSKKDNKTIALTNEGISILNEGPILNSVPNGTTAKVAKVWLGTQAEYDNMVTHDSDTLYFIKA